MFIKIGDNAFNVRYIKKITPTCIVIANTAAIGYTARFNTSNETVYASDTIIGLTEEQHQYIMDQLDYPNIIRELQKENDELKIQLHYRPGGPGYESAKIEFDTLK